MGQRNSTETRVVPVFDALMDKDSSGRSWLMPLLSLGSRSDGRLGADIGELRPNHPRWWGKNEKRLDPPIELLRLLVNTVKKPSSNKGWGTAENTIEKRKLLAKGDTGTIREALDLLEGAKLASRVWYVLEGLSQPDAYLETDELIVVIEGKRTEPTATKRTTWMPKRCQMLRHMDAAWEIRGTKRVLGMMIVEAPNGACEVSPIEYWQDDANKQVGPESMASSLPHRCALESEQIADGFLGVTTWQRVCAEFGITLPPD